MRDNKAVMLLAAAFTLTVAGCSGRDNDEGSVVQGSNITITVPEDTTDTSNVTTTATEPTVSTETTDGTATPVAQVSSAQMDRFIKNALLAEIPSELDGSTTTAVAASFIVNPLLN